MKSVTHCIHLTEDQIDDALIGDLSAEGMAHLSSCDECRLRLADAEAPLASFNVVSLAWSERRSATLPRPDRSSEAAWLPKALWGATVAALLAVGITVPLVRHGRQDESSVLRSETAGPTLLAASGPMENPVAVRDEQIARDNQMLENIDRELATPAASPVREYGLQVIGGPSGMRSAPASIPN